MKIELSNSSYKINDTPFTYPIDTESLKVLIGEPSRVVKLKYNTVLTWDDLGIYCHSKDGSKIAAINVLLNDGEDYRFTPKKIFSGSLLIHGEDIRNRAIVEEERVGDVLAFNSLDREDKTIISTCLEPYQEKEPKQLKDPNRYKQIPIKGKAIVFKDFNFKLAIIQILMYEKELIHPKFDVYDFIERHTDRAIDIEEEGYDLIPEVTAYFKALEIDEKFALEITEIEQDGGDDIYGEMMRFWSGEDDEFNIQSAEDAKSFPNLKSVNLFYEDEPIVKNQFIKAGIEADNL